MTELLCDQANVWTLQGTGRHDVSQFLTLYLKASNVPYAAPAVMLTSL